MMGHRVLVVEDDLTIRETLLEVLEDEGYEVAAASNGYEALACLQEAAEPPCLILLDVMMPLMDGLEFRRQQMLRPAFAEIPVVILTAGRDVTNAAQELHIEQVLRKPLHLVDLLGVVGRFCPAAGC